MTKIASAAHTATFIATVSVLSVLCCGGAQAQPLSREVDFNVAAQRLATAIVQFSEQAHVQIISSGIDVADQDSPGVVGRHTVANALNIMLKGTGLRFKAMNENTVALQSIKERPESTTRQSETQAPGSVLASSAHTPSGDQPPAARGLQQSSEGSSMTDNGRLGEIVVTAQKRTERLQDVPVPVTAINAESLVETNQVRLQDYYTAIPGLTVTPNTQSQQLLSIRGITTGISNPTVGITIDGVPFGSSTNNGGGSVVPDIDPNDLSRIEVLRGPQGTLYGASSMGGLVTFVTVDPSTSAVSGRVQAGTVSVYNGNGLGYNTSASVNVPLSDTFAVRASGFLREDSGYIDNPVLGRDGVNEVHARGGLLAALWRPMDVVSFKVSALYQEIKGGGSSDVDLQPGLADLQQNYAPGVGAYDRKVQAYSATTTARIGAVDLTAVTGYNVNEFSDSNDYSYLYGGLTQSVYGVSAAPEFNYNRTGKFFAGDPGHCCAWPAGRVVGGWVLHPRKLRVPAESAGRECHLGSDSRGQLLLEFSDHIFRIRGFHRSHVPFYGPVRCASRRPREPRQGILFAERGGASSRIANANLYGAAQLRCKCVHILGNPSLQAHARPHDLCAARFRLSRGRAKFESGIGHSG